jgi:hypothetical protein
LSNTSSLDDLGQQFPEQAGGGRLEWFRQMFSDDFGDLGGEFVMNGSLAEYQSSFDGRPVVIRGQHAPSGAREYTINGSRWTMPGDFALMDMDAKRQALVQALRIYV